MGIMVKSVYNFIKDNLFSNYINKKNDASKMKLLCRSCRNVRMRRRGRGPGNGAPNFTWEDNG